MIATFYSLTRASPLYASSVVILQQVLGPPARPEIIPMDDEAARPVCRLSR